MEFNKTIILEEVSVPKVEIWAVDLIKTHWVDVLAHNRIWDQAFNHVE